VTIAGIAHRIDRQRRRSVGLPLRVLESPSMVPGWIDIDGAPGPLR
jgi:hypothetical protein